MDMEITVCDGVMVRPACDPSCCERIPGEVEIALYDPVRARWAKRNIPLLQLKAAITAMEICIEQ